MGTIRMLNLYRCSSVEPRAAEKEMDYMLMDFFDGIKVEELNVDKSTLAECMGIKWQLDERKKGVSDQRYCLYSENSEDNSLFESSLEYPVITVIQVFINSDLYQASSFADDTDEIICKNIMKKVRRCIQNTEAGKNAKWNLYHLLTEGDFAIVVRSEKLHDAYDIASAVRSMKITREGSVLDAAFFSYSISGVLNQEGEENKANQICWSKYLDIEDEVLLRIQYSQQFYAAELTGEDLQIVADFTGLGHRLFGRYDFKISLTGAEFQELYPYIHDFKFDHISITDSEIEKFKSPKVKGILWMMMKGYIAYFNEKLSLKYASAPMWNNESADVLEIVCGENHKWVSLLEVNFEQIAEEKEKVRELEGRLSCYYQNARNLRDYVRLLYRAYRILYEMNHLQELRVSVANLLTQIKVMVQSSKNYLDYAESQHWKKVEIADRLEEYLRLGMSAIEIFTRYARNVNLQTLQTSNYDLQTNVCVEKVLLAYSQFLRPLMTRREGESSQSVYLTDTLYPILVPNMAVKDLSVCVLFDDDHVTMERQGENGQKLMVLSSPTFSFLCETCFVLTTVFHEIGHQFRYEEREIRNLCITRYLIKNISFQILRQLIDPEQKFGFVDEPAIKELVEDICDEFMKENPYAAIRKEGLQTFGMKWNGLISEFSRSIIGEKTCREVVSAYLNETRDCILDYEKMPEWICKIEDALDQLENNAEKPSEKRETEHWNVFEVWSGLVIWQYRQIWDMCIELVKNSITNEEGKDSEFITELEKKAAGIQQPEQWFEVFCELWDRVHDKLKDFLVKNDIRNCVKKEHRIAIAYRTAVVSYKNSKVSDSTGNQELLKHMSKYIYQKTEKKIFEFEVKRDTEFQREAISITSRDVEYIRKKIKLQKEQGVERIIREIFAEEKVELLQEFVDNSIEMYREVTADLFMCSVMDLSVFGYLVVVAENFAFRENTQYALYRRVSQVLQCLIKEQFRKNTESEETEFDVNFTEVLQNELVNQITILKSNLGDAEQTGKSATDDGVIVWDFRKIKLLLENLLEVEIFNSTQKWILRIYNQIAHIVYNVTNVCAMSDEILERDIWNDISSSKAFLANKSKLQDMIQKDGDKTLCKDITSILNSPASFFANRKSLLEQEVQFVLRNYEENRRSILKRK